MQIVANTFKARTLAEARLTIKISHRYFAAIAHELERMGANMHCVGWLDVVGGRPPLWVLPRASTCSTRRICISFHCLDLLSHIYMPPVSSSCGCVLIEAEPGQRRERTTLHDKAELTAALTENRRRMARHG